VHLGPLLQRTEHDAEIAPRRGQPILGPRSLARLAIVGPLENATLDELVESRTEHVGSNAEARLHVGEPRHARVGLAQDQQRPSIADEGQGTLNRTTRSRCGMGRSRLT
jgi:hypothetical protein